jgi:GntR family transcriptional regulator, transcriptional repressor for pyruvate dehydrogenase complex
MQIDLEFHLAIANCTQNPLAKTIITAITKSYLESNMNWDDKNKKMITANAEKIVDAITKKDSETARLEMDKHIINFL